MKLQADIKINNMPTAQILIRERFLKAIPMANPDMECYRECYRPGGPSSGPQAGRTGRGSKTNWSKIDHEDWFLKTCLIPAGEQLTSNIAGSFRLPRATAF